MSEFDFGPGLRIEERIDAAEAEGVTERWEFGRWMLTHVPEGGQQLPHGFIEGLRQATGKSERELRYRRQFAERFPTREEVGTAVQTFRSWTDIREHALVREPAERPETPLLPEGKFSTITADPPWDVKTPPAEFGGSGMAQALEYPTMDVEAIAALDVKAHVPENAHLYLWTINAYVENAYDIARAWGFEPSTLLVWCKAPHGIGQGGAYVLTTEYVLFARRGTLPHTQRVDRSWFEWPRAGHSVKPEDFYEVVERVSPGPYLEMFARRAREGWTSWGSEVSDAVAA